MIKERLILWNAPIPVFSCYNEEDSLSIRLAGIYKIGG